MTQQTGYWPDILQAAYGLPYIAKNSLMDLMDNPSTGLPTSSTGPTQGKPLRSSPLAAQFTPPAHPAEKMGI